MIQLRNIFGKEHDNDILRQEKIFKIFKYRIYKKNVCIIYVISIYIILNCSILIVQIFNIEKDGKREDQLFCL